MSHVPCGDLMTRRRRLPAASAWVLWSSPLLLVVLVLTLGATGRTGSPSATGSAREPSSAPPVATTTSTTALTRHRRAPGPGRTSGPRETTAATTTTTTETTTPSRPTRASAAPSTADSSSSTVSSATVSDGVSATNGPVAGRLDAALASVVVPLAGPRTWTLASSAPLSATLACGAQETTVTATFAVGSTSCQLDLADPTGQAVAWQLTPGG